MYTTYVIQNRLSGRYYTGSTKDLERRIREHNRGQTRSTRRGVWSVVYCETYSSTVEAKRREKQIKSYKGGNAFKKLLAGVVQQ